jgi:hypothetical protein
MVQGRQHTFGFEGVWKSDALPRPGVVVDVEFDAAGHVTGMTAVPDARLAKEQAEAAIALASAKGAGALARFGVPQLAALALLAVGWFWLAALGVDRAPLGPVELTFWQALGALAAGQPLETWGGGSAPSTGAYGVGALVCFAAPLLICVWNDRRAHLAAMLPLAFMLAVALPLVDLARQTNGVVFAAVSLGAGTGVSLLAGLYLALAGIKRFLIAAAADATVFYENR